VIGSGGNDATVVVVATYASADRAAVTVRSALDNGHAACLVVDVDGTYERCSDETVQSFDKLVAERGLQTEATLAAATLDPDAYEFYAEVVGATAALSRTDGSGVVVLAAGVLVLGDLRPLAAAARDGLAVLPRTEPDALVHGVETSSEYRGAAHAFGPMDSVTQEAVACFARAIYAVGTGVDLDSLRRMAADWRVASTALDVFATSQSTTVLRGDAALIAAWRGTPGSIVTRDEAGALQLDGDPVVAVDLSHFDPAKPWVMDATAPLLPAIRLSEQPALRDTINTWAHHFPAVKDDDHDANAPARLDLDEPLRTEMRRAHVLRAPLPDVLGPHAGDGDQQLMDWAAELVPPAHRRPVARYLAGVRATRRDLREAFPQVPGPDSVRLARWALASGVKEQYDADLLRRCAEATIAAQPADATPAGGPKAPRRPRGINLVGYLSGEMGLGESGRLMDAALHATGVPTSTFDVSRGLQSRQTAAFRQSDSTLYDTTLACVNASETAGAFTQLGDVATRTRRIGMWYWELEDFPEAHQTGFEHVDEVWAATDFIRDAIARHAGDTPVRTVMPPLPQRGDEDAGPLPARFGIPEDRPFFLFTFDYLSLAGRKNPYGLVEAFVRAFPEPSPDGPLLVIKTINGDRAPIESERLQIQAADLPHVLLIDEYLDNHERHVLVAHCAAYVSLHKAEGLGLTITEAMAWGKPVIVTAYGGPLQFMTEQNSFAVGWQPGSIPERMGPYAKGLRWAEPDLDEAGRLMRLVIEDPERAAAVGAQAARDIRELHNVEVAGARIREVLDQGTAEWEAARAAKRALRQEARRRQREQEQASAAAATPVRPRHNARRIASAIKRRIQA
jgi:glycosyltransferase involved in cell wall biosynthesis